MAYDDLMRLGSYNAAKEQGLVRSEGKEYVVKDGDVVLFRFNVWFDFLKDSEYEKGMFLKADYL